MFTEDEIRMIQMLRRTNISVEEASAMIASNLCEGEEHPKKEAQIWDDFSHSLHYQNLKNVI